MKRLPVFILSIVLMAILVLPLTACSGTPSVNEPQTSGNPVDTGTRLPKSDAVISGKIAHIYDSTFLLAGSGASDLYMVSSKLTIYGLDGKITDASALKAGQNVEIGYSGSVMESYPAQLGSPVYIKITKLDDDLIGFYLTILNDLWNVDKGLNSDIKLLAFDLTKVTNLSEAEKSALIYIMSNAHGVGGIKGTFDELSNQGYIDKQNLYFKDGILLSFKLSEVTENSFSFDAEKWRSGLGAYIFHDCKAVKSSKGWTYTVGAHMIS